MSMNTRTWGQPDTMTTSNTNHTDDPPSSSPADPSRTFRIEHRTSGASATVLARVHGVFAHHDALTPYAARLLRQNDPQFTRGELVLVDDATDQVVARRALDHGLVPRRTQPPRPKHAL